MTSNILTTFNPALSTTQTAAMRAHVYLDDDGYRLVMAAVHGNAVRGLARHGLLVVSDAVSASLTPLGVRLHAALTKQDEVRTLTRHAEALGQSLWFTPVEPALDGIRYAMLHAAGLEGEL